MEYSAKKKKRAVKCNETASYCETEIVKVEYKMESSESGIQCQEKKIGVLEVICDRELQ